MLKKRLIAALPLVQGRVVQSISFSRYLPVGTPEVCAEALNAWGADELMVLDIHATREGRKPDPALVKRISNRITMPLSYGGGIRSVDDMVALIHSGADKLVINSAVLENPRLITEGAAVLGNQCIIVSMDVKQRPDGQYEVVKQGKGTGKTPEAWAAEAVKLGAGEIHVNSIDRDGAGTGYDAVLLEKILKAVSVPVIFMGGAGHPEHFLECFKKGVDALVAGNFFQFTEHSVTVTKAYLQRHGVHVRMDTTATYEHTDFDEAGRIAKLSEAYLKGLRYSVIPKEVI